MRFSLAVILWLIMGGGAYADALEYDAFARLPIQHEGRIKPINTFALVHLERFYGKPRIDGQSAVEWLAGVMFNPSEAMEQPLFLLKDADAQSMLNLSPRPDNLYNFAEATEAIAANQSLVKSLLQAPAETATPGQRAVLKFYEDTGLFTQLMLSSTLFLTLSVDLPPRESEALGLDRASPPPSAFMDYYRYLPQLQRRLQEVVQRKGAELDRYTPDETQLADAVRKLSMTLDTSRDNILLRAIPPQWGHDDAWLSPWEMFHSGQGSPQSAGIMRQWRELAQAYQAHDAARWREAVSALAESVKAAPGVRPEALSLEVLYYQYGPLGKSMLLYIAGFVLTLYCLSGLSAWRRGARLMAIGATGLGAFLHALSILARIYILERPPVGTLYESLLFVSLIAVLFGLFLESRLRNSLGLLVATLAGSVLLFASQSFSGDDTMSMLIAVLNTNFWLATHVLCITTGYGFGMAAGIIAHVYLISACLNRDADKIRQALRGGYGTALIALLFTSLGTILGGIWADQSWGRFWGWDPKENGALMICLWLIWILHGRISGRMGERGFAVALALLNIVIALSWLGVNLLATGLHSYGFTDKAAWALAAFCAAECSFAAAAYLILWRRENAEI